ncbi:MAG: hypothetical protein L0332_08675 [Chloroflexi bacterium]|nr:hypothetical protein [Chloroflexota bacterium]MCI0645275.1 hypothetical protein [Chloroflexota bacterium]MCI0726779.1 hypothetical protein [Chloroflexota bacterium]
MADLPPYKTPRWVKIFGISVLVLVLLVVAALLVATALGLHTPGGPGGHGPGRPTPSQTPLSSIIEGDTLPGGDLAGQTSRSSVTEHDVQQL